MAVVAVDHLSFATLTMSSLPALNMIAEQGTLGLISPGLARYPKPSENEWASFTAGDVVSTNNDHMGLLQRQLAANGDGDRVELIHFGDVVAPGRLRALDALLAKLTGQGRIVILCGVTPPELTDGSWNQLSPIAIYPSWGNAGGSIISETTRTRGLIALRDLAPTILSLVGAPVPLSMSGAPARPCPLATNGSALKDRLRRMVTVTALGQRVIVPFCWFLGIAAILAIAGGGMAASGLWTMNLPLVCFLLRIVIAAPLALLLAPVLPVANVGEYMAALVALNLALACLPSINALLSLTSLTLIVDVLTGSHLLSVSVISGFWLSGIRFYGIGNEYMGVLIGMSLLAPTLVLQNHKLKLSKGVKSLLTGSVYVAVIVVLSYPAFGAKAGGAVTSVVTFALAWTAIYTGVRPNWRSFVLASAAGFALIFAFAVLATRLHAPASHIQAAVGAVHQGRLGYIKHLAIRKTKMAVRTVLTPGGGVAVVAFLSLWFVWSRSVLRVRIDEYLLSRVEFAEALTAGIWGLAAALLFNDSGGVAVLFIFGALALVLFHEMVRSLCVSSR